MGVVSVCGWSCENMRFSSGVLAIKSISGVLSILANVGGG